MRSIWRRNSIAVSLGTGCFFSGASTATGSAFFFTDMARTALSLPMNANGARYHAPERAGKGSRSGLSGTPRRFLLPDEEIADAHEDEGHQGRGHGAVSKPGQLRTLHPGPPGSRRRAGERGPLAKLKHAGGTGGIQARTGGPESGSVLDVRPPRRRALPFAQRVSPEALVESIRGVGDESRVD